MSGPVLVTCWTCQNRFVFLRGTMTKCPQCGTEYQSHRDAPDEPAEKQEELTEQPAK